MTFFLRKTRVRKKPTNINNFVGLSQKWVGVKLFMCFPFSWEKGKHINKIPRKSQEKAGRVPGQSRDNPGTIPWKFCLCVFLFIGFFLALKTANTEFTKFSSVRIPEIDLIWFSGLAPIQRALKKAPWLKSPGHGAQNASKMTTFVS